MLDPIDHKKTLVKLRADLVLLQNNSPANLDDLSRLKSVIKTYKRLYEPDYNLIDFTPQRTKKMNLAEVFKSTRLQCDISIKQMTHILKRSRNTINRIESGDPLGERTKTIAEQWVNKNKLIHNSTN